MRPIAFIRQMLAAGVDLDTALMAAEKFEDQAEQEREAMVADLLDRLARDVKTEARKARDRDRKRGNPRNSVESEEIAEILSEGSEGFPKPLPTPPNLSKEPPIVPQKASKSRRKGDFTKFWAAYPLKVGKLKAERCYATALGRCEGDDPEAEILEGLERCKPLWEPEYIPHATTWLNRGGWLDQLTPEDSSGAKRVVDLGAWEARKAENRRMYGAAE